MKHKRIVAPFPLKHKKWNRLRFFLFAGLIIIIFLVFLLAFSTVEYYELAKQVKSQQEKASLLGAENLELEKEINLLKEGRYIEILARRLLGLVKPGESIFILDD